MTVRNVRAPQPRRPSTQADGPVAPGTPEFARQKAAVKGALDEMNRLAPRVGWEISVADHEKLPKAAQAVLHAFGQSREYVKTQATNYEMGPPHLRHADEAWHPASTPQRLDAALKPFGKDKGDAAAILLSAAKTPGLPAHTKEALTTAAETWKGRAKSADFKAAIALRPPANPPTASRSGVSSYERRAEREWELAPPARGWSNGPERRELDDPRAEPPDIGNLDSAGAAWGLGITPRKAYTLEEWKAIRVPQLKARDAADSPS